MIYLILQWRNQVIWDQISPHSLKFIHMLKESFKKIVNILFTEMRIMVSEGKPNKYL